MKNTDPGKVLFYIFLGAFAVIAAFFCVYLQKTHREYTNLKQRQEQYTRQLEEAERELAYKEKYYSNLMDNPKFVERVVRQKLGYAKPEEILFRFESAE